MLCLDCRNFRRFVTYRGQLNSLQRYAADLYAGSRVIYRSSKVWKCKVHVSLVCEVDRSVFACGRSLGSVERLDRPAGMAMVTERQAISILDGRLGIRERATRVSVFCIFTLLCLGEVVILTSPKSLRSAVQSNHSNDPLSIYQSNVPFSWLHHQLLMRFVILFLYLYCLLLLSILLMLIFLHFQLRATI